MSGLTCPAAPAAGAPQSFLNCLGYILTPQVWKQAQQAAGRRRALRWQRQPLILVLLVMTWCAGDSLPERFETARAFYVACHQRRRRPGKTFPGFEKALGKMPLRVLRAVPPRSDAVGRGVFRRSFCRSRDQRLACRAGYSPVLSACKKRLLWRFGTPFGVPQGVPRAVRLMTAALAQLAQATLMLPGAGLSEGSYGYSFEALTSRLACRDCFACDLKSASLGFRSSPSASASVVCRGLRG
jgi:uncharacterized protein YjeT (DUF2065 family)